MRKKARLFFSMMAVCLLTLFILKEPVMAAGTEGTCGESLAWKLDEEGVLTISGTGAMADYEEPEQDEETLEFINSAPWGVYSDIINKVVIEEGVTSIGAWSFAECTSIQEVEFQSWEDLLEIRTGAFKGCTAINMIWMPDSILEIGEYAFKDAGIYACLISDNAENIGKGAFYGCENLQEVIIPENVKTLGANAFRECLSLKKVDLRGNNISCETGTFMYCRNLSEVLIADGITEISSYMFFGCDGLKNIVLPDTVTSIGDSAFAYCTRNADGTSIDGWKTSYTWAEIESCTGLESITFSKNLTEIGTEAFTHCFKLSAIEIPDTVKEIKDRAFRSCYTLKEADLGRGVKTIGARAFASCAKLETIEIPKNVSTICEYTFTGCKALSSISFSNKVKSIENNAFKNCSELQTVYYGGTETQWKEISIGETGNDTLLGALIYYTDDAIVEEVNRISGTTRYETGYKVADALKAELGVEKFDAIVVATGKNFADALAGSYLAVQKNAPILLTNGKADNVAQLHEYIKANVSANGTVYILGGEGAVPATVEAIDGYDVVRLAGKSRYETNLAILAEAGIEGDELIVATGKTFADSLSASAAKLPILLVKPGIALTDEAKAIAEGRTKFYIIGGEGAVSTDIEAELAAYGEVVRVSGKTRYETSVAVANTFFIDVEEAVVASGKNFPDGLCGGPLAAAMNAPLILTADGKTDAAADYMAENAVASGFVLGGSGALADKAIVDIFALESAEEIVLK